MPFQNPGSNLRFDASSKSYGCLNKKKLKNLCKKSTLRIFSEVLQYKTQDINMIRDNDGRRSTVRNFPKIFYLLFLTKWRPSSEMFIKNQTQFLSR